MSRSSHVVFGPAAGGQRRASPTMSVTAESSASAARTLVPTFPVAPVTTTLMLGYYPGAGGENAALEAGGVSRGARTGNRRERR